MHTPAMLGATQKLWLGMIAMAAVGVMAFVVNKEGLASATTAAWLQALGSLAALAAVYWSTSATVRHDRAKRDEDRVSFAIIAHHVADQLAEAIAQAEAALRATPVGAFSDENFAGIEFALQELDLTKAPTGRIAIAVLNLRRLVHFYRDGYIDAHAARSAGAAIAPKLRGELTRLAAAATQHSEVIEADAKGLLKDFQAEHG